MRKLIRMIRAALVAEWCRWFGFDVVVMWEGEVFRHTSPTHNDAMHWARQYGADCAVSIYQFGAPVTCRGPSLFNPQPIY